ncbi:twin-arginine translocase TatA/TatE family subunit [Cellvibrio polysaccharolyticus]|uniref:Sec-independent protein translocase protein TatA n=1 Tax=Cellvibrio polysaccharolyticus TaxID=2082724 RepID=A0A928V4P0_9GAMM|nr:twin-arginine translocase TatA/TatE family subunit [Cellvibrio polysaccharolyticus]MBE8718718.1 twin-arginine translocase TatA/TatE family subunit [Cellvibrio polysaccharolyticus]
MGINSPWQLLLIFAIILLLFGTKRLRSLGSDLGSAIKGFKKSMGDEEAANKTAEPQILDDKTTTETRQTAARETHEQK